jgi:hypothetical protein
MSRVGDQFDFIQVRHEEMAAFMACGHAKFTGEVDVCLATSGPGAIHLLNGLYDAKLDHQSVVAIVGPTGASRTGRTLSARGQAGLAVRRRRPRIRTDDYSTGPGTSCGRSGDAPIRGGSEK